MRLVELAVLYGLVGGGSAVAAWVIRPRGAPSTLDTSLLVLLWPLYGPFYLARLSANDQGLSGQEAAFLAALRRATGTPLSVLLPDETTARALARRLRVATAKIEEIDALLRRPEFFEEDAVARLRDLEQRDASACARSTLQLRIQNIRRLRSLRDRFIRELDEVGELIAQLTTQADVVRLAGVAGDETRDLVQEIVTRVEGLDRMMDDDGGAWEKAS